MNVEELSKKLEELASEAVEALAQAPRKEDAIQIKNRYLGRKGDVQELMKVLRELQNDERRVAGQASNACKNTIEEAFEGRMRALADEELQRKMREEAVDITLPARPLNASMGHPLRQIEQELIGIFEEMGFEVAEIGRASCRERG